MLMYAYNETVWIYPLGNLSVSVSFLPQNGTATIEEFHQEIQDVTNHPLKEFIIPFLRVSYVNDLLEW